MFYSYEKDKTSSRGWFNFLAIINLEMRRILEELLLRKQSGKKS